MNTTDRIDELRKKFDENPRRYFAPLANEYRKAGDLLQAIGLCREHLPKQPGHMSGYIVFGQALYESGELTEAQSVFEQALALDPENLIALRHLGDIARDTGDDSTARRWYSRVLDADPRNEDIVAQIATLSASRTPTSGAIVPNFDTLARPSETPAFAVDTIGLSGIPTPDAVMRAVDLDGWTARPAQHAPIDLDLLTPPAREAAAFVEPSAPMEPIDLDDHLTAPTEGVSFIAEVAHGIPTSPSAVPAVASLVDDDPFGFPQPETDRLPEVLSEHAVDTPAASFEEGLVAPEWTDAAIVVSRIVTPRDAVAYPPARAVEAPAETLAAFGREEGDPEVSDPFGAFAAPASRSGSAEPTTPTSHDDIFSVAAEAPDDIFSVAAEAPDDIFSVAAEAPGDIFSDAAEAPGDIFSVTEAPLEATIHPWTDAATLGGDRVGAESSVESLFEHADEMEVDAPVDTTDVGEGDLAVNAIMAAFVDTPSALDSNLTGAVDDVVSIESLEYDNAVVDQHGSDRDVFALQPSSLDVFDQQAFDDADASSDSSFVTPPSSPAFVTETMAELLVSQGFVDRAADVYDELVQRHPYDPALALRRDEVRAMCAPVAAQSDAMAFGARASATPADVTPVVVTSVTDYADAIVASYATPSVPLTAVTTAATTPSIAPYAHPTAETDAPTPRLAREWFAALAARRVPRRTPSQAASIVPQSSEGLASLFGTDASTHDDVAARALADAFAPIPDEELAAGTALDFSFATPTPDFTSAIAPRTPSASMEMQQPVHSPRESVARRTTPPSGNAGFAFDKFFPDPAARRVTPPESTPVPPATPVADDLAQFSSWLKGLGQT